ncbi:hypothetical protein [Nonomuraea insulae]|uniref:DDE superfamily endonuclease n=1 Tax=Nonomuraea insulae TaxID=1616787 RepID=A0ABW1CGF3_9ACTN
MRAPQQIAVPAQDGVGLDWHLSWPLCLPVLAQLWRPGRTGKIAFAREMVEAIAARHPALVAHAVDDAAYTGEHLRGLDPSITWTSRLKVTSVLHALPPPRTGRSGRLAPRSPAGHPGRPGRDRHLAHHPGTPLRTHRYRAEQRNNVSVVRAVPQPEHPRRPGPRHPPPHP